MPNNRSDAALRERLEIAGKATQGPWIKKYRDFQGEDGFGWESKPTVEAEDKMICLFYDREVGDEEDAAHIAASSPDVVRADIEEILRLRKEVARLNKEADWLVRMLSHYTEDCPLKFAWLYAEEMLIPKIDGCDGAWPDDDYFDCSNSTPEKCWREAARKAVEDENG